MNPVAALEQQFDDTDDSDTSTPDTVVWVADPACTPGNPVGACAMAPVVIVGGYVVAEEVIYLICAGGTVAAVVHVSSSSPSSNNQLVNLNVMGTWFKDTVHQGLKYMQKTGTFVWSTVVHPQHQKIDIYTPGSEQYHLFHKQLEQDYNDAKEKGTPTKNNKDQIGHGIDNKAEDIVPYMSVSLFHNLVDKDNGCPKQIRYYGKDGKAELDIDFSHDGPYALPHKHPWSNGKRYGHGDLNFEGIKKVIENWRCKDYDYKNHMFKESDI